MQPKKIVPNSDTLNATRPRPNTINPLSNQHVSSHPYFAGEFPRAAMMVASLP